MIGVIRIGDDQRFVLILPRGHVMIGVIGILDHRAGLIGKRDQIQIRVVAIADLILFSQPNLVDQILGIVMEGYRFAVF